MADVKVVDEKSIATGFMSEDEDGLGDASDSAVDPWIYAAIIDAWMKLASSRAAVEPELGQPLVSGVLRYVLAATRAARSRAEERMRGAFQSP
jgi:hypothetical protein